MDRFLGLHEVDWAAVNAMGTLALIFVSALAGAIAFYQVTSARLEGRKSRTMLAIEKYDSDIILDRALVSLRSARMSGFLNPAHSKLDILIVMNYLDAIALGIAKDVYEEDLVRAFMESIVETHLDEFVDGGLLAKAGGDLSDFTAVCELRNKWRAK